MKESAIRLPTASPHAPIEASITIKAKVLAPATAHSTMSQGRILPTRCLLEAEPVEEDDGDDPAPHYDVPVDTTVAPR